MGRFGMGNWSLKVLSLILAVVLWVYVSNELNPTKEQEYKAVPVETRAIGSNLAVTGPPDSVNVKVQANQSVLAKLNPRSIEVFVNLSKAKPGKIVVPVQVKVPAGVKVTDLRPQEVSVTLEPLVEKQVPLKVRSLDTPAKGYRVLAYELKPNQVILRGSKSIIDRIDFASADINLKNRDKSFSATVPVKVIDNQGNFVEQALVKRTPTVVDILVSIVPDMPFKTVQVVPRLIGEPAAGYIIQMTEVDPRELIITGDQNLINSISQVYSQPVDITGAKNDVYIDAAPDLPEDVTANRQSLRVLVKIVPQ